MTQEMGKPRRLEVRLVGLQHKQALCNGARAMGATAITHNRQSEGLLYIHLPPVDTPDQLGAELWARHRVYFSLRWWQEQARRWTEEERNEALEWLAKVYVRQAEEDWPIRPRFFSLEQKENETNTAEEKDTAEKPGIQDSKPLYDESPASPLGREPSNSEVEEEGQGEASEAPLKPSCVARPISSGSENIRAARAAADLAWLLITTAALETVAGWASRLAMTAQRHFATAATSSSTTERGGSETGQRKKPMSG